MTPWKLLELSAENHDNFLRFLQVCTASGLGATQLLPHLLHHEQD